MVCSRSLWPNSIWMLRRSAPCSSRCVAKQCLSVWGCTSFWMPARLAAFRHACQTTFVEIGLSLVWCRLPGNSHTLGLRFNRHQCSRSSLSSFGLSITSRSDVPGKVMYCGPGRNLRRQAPGSDCPAHNYLPLNEAMSLSVGRKKPRFRVGGRTASSISRFCEGSVRRYTSVL